MDLSRHHGQTTTSRARQVHRTTVQLATARGKFPHPARLPVKSLRSASQARATTQSSRDRGRTETRESLSILSGESRTESSCFGASQGSTDHRSRRRYSLRRISVGYFGARHGLLRPRSATSLRWQRQNSVCARRTKIKSPCCRSGDTNTSNRTGWRCRTEPVVRTAKIQEGLSLLW